MKKKNVSFVSNDKSAQMKPGKKQKNLIKFNCEGSALSPFISKSSNKIKTISFAKEPSDEKIKPETERKIQSKPIALSQLKIIRSNKGGKFSGYLNSCKTFNNSLLLLDYGSDEVYTDSASRAETLKDQSPKNEQPEDAEVTKIVESCVKVITEETQHSSNPISARFTPQDMTPTSAESPNLDYSLIFDPYFYYMNSQKLQSNGRVRRSVNGEESKVYIIDMNKVENDGRTTIMIRNIPNKYTQEMLLQLFEKNHKKKFDFFYLPIDYNNSCNVGYAFLNFIHTKFINEFYLQFHEHKWRKFNSTKVCKVCYARIQGTAQLENHFEHSNVIQQREKRFRPLIGLKSLNDINSLVNKQKNDKEEEVFQE